jgi:hypothetical protein
MAGRTEAQIPNVIIACHVGGDWGCQLQQQSIYIRLPGLPKHTYQSAFDGSANELVTNEHVGKDGKGRHGQCDTDSGNRPFDLSALIRDLVE